MRSKSQMVAEIFTTIERLERELASLKELVQQAISKETIGSEIFVDANYIDGIDSEILVDAKFLKEDSKPRAKSKGERRLEGQQCAREWAELEKKKKKPDNQQSHH